MLVRAKFSHPLEFFVALFEGTLGPSTRQPRCCGCTHRLFSPPKLVSESYLSFFLLPFFASFYVNSLVFSSLKPPRAWIGDYGDNPSKQRCGEPISPIFSTLFICGDYVVSFSSGTSYVPARCLEAVGSPRTRPIPTSTPPPYPQLVHFVNS